MSAVPLERFHDLSHVPAAGYDLDIVPGVEELRAFAQWAGVDEVARLRAHLSVHARSKTRFLEEIEFEADVVQRCVVTLQPVHTHIARSFTRVLHLVPGVQHVADNGGAVAASVISEDSP